MIQRIKFILLFVFITNFSFGESTDNDSVPKGLYDAITKGGLILPTIKDLTLKIVVLSESIFVLFFIIYIGYMYYKHHTFDLNTKKLVESLTNGLIIFIGLGIYIPIANSVVSIASIINSSMAMNPTELVKYMGYFVFETSWTAFFGPGFLVILGIAVQAVRFFMLMYSLVMMNILYCFGPLAIAFSLLFQDKFQLWFTTFLNIVFVPLTVGVLDRIIYGVMVNMLEHLPNKNLAGSMTVAYSVIITGIVSYALAPWLTSNFVGNKTSGIVLSVAGQYVMKGAGNLAKTSASFMNSIGSFSNSASSAVNTGTQGAKDIINNNKKS